MRKKAAEQVEGVVSVILEAFEERYRAGLRTVLGPAFLDPIKSETCDSVFQDRIEAFRVAMQRYRIQLATIEKFAFVFRRDAGRDPL
jgi:hypothetical protein